MKKLYLIVLTIVFVAGCAKIPQSEYEYIDIPNQTKEMK